VFARKLLRPFANLTREEIESEARAIIRIYLNRAPPNLIQVISHGWVNEAVGLYRIDMELCACNLEQYMNREVDIRFEMRHLACPGRFAEVGSHPGPWQKWDIMEQICEGVRFIHSKDLVHRDVKPRNGKPPPQVLFNCIVLYSPELRLWKVADFGLTKEGTSRRHVTTEFGAGTSSYRAPELLIASRYNNKVDVFAIGCIFFELFADGIKAFKDDREVKQYYQSEARLRPRLVSLAFSSVDSLFSLIPAVFRPTPQQQSALGSMGSALLSRLLEQDPERRPSAEWLSLDYACNRWISFAKYYHEHNDLQLAMEAYRFAIDISAVEPSIWKAFGDACYASGSYGAAVDAYERATAAGYGERIDNYDRAFRAANPPLVDVAIPASDPDLLIFAEIPSIDSEPHSGETDDPDSQETDDSVVEANPGHLVSPSDVHEPASLESLPGYAEEFDRSDLPAYERALPEARGHPSRPLLFRERLPTSLLLILFFLYVPTQLGWYTTTFHITNLSRGAVGSRTLGFCMEYGVHQLWGRLSASPLSSPCSAR
jgi:tetratricopeptide (TPR) repeat protein